MVVTVKATPVRGLWATLNRTHPQFCAKGKDANCPDAFHKSTDNYVQVACKDKSFESINQLLILFILKFFAGQENNVDLVIAFCA